MADITCDTCLYVHDSKKAIIDQNDQNVFCSSCKHVHNSDLSIFGVQVCHLCGICRYPGAYGCHCQPSTL